MRRITKFERATAAARILASLNDAITMRQDERNQIFADVVRSEDQRVLVLIRNAAEDCRRRASSPIESALAAHLEKACENDPDSANGLTATATRSLALACDALTKSVIDDHEAGLLDQGRMEMLIGGGLGMHAVGTALAESFLADFPE